MDLGEDSDQNSLDLLGMSARAFYGCGNAYALSTNRAQKLVVRILTGATDWRFRVSKIKPQLPVPPRYKKISC